MLKDIYVLAKNRSVEIALRFLENWAAGFQEVAEEYEFPQYSGNPEIVYKEVKRLIERLVREPTEPHAIYWTNPELDNDISAAMCFFTIDEQLIVGISARLSDEIRLEKILQQIAKDVNGEWGGIFFSQPPPDSSTEFVNMVANSDYPKIKKDTLVQSQ